MNERPMMSEQYQKARPPCFATTEVGSELLAALDAYAADEGLSRSAILRRILVNALSSLGRIDRNVTIPRGRSASHAMLERAAS